MRKKFPWWKLISGFVLFIFFHQIYDLLGGGIVGAILGESIESIYSHMKMFFYAYLVVSTIDYLIRRREITAAGSFWTARMLVATSFPWMTIAIWFIPIALGFDLGRIEFTYSLILTTLGLYFAIRLDEGLENVEFLPALKAMIWLAFAAALITYIGFSFRVPENFFGSPGISVIGTQILGCEPASQAHTPKSGLISLRLRAANGGENRRTIFSSLSNKGCTFVGCYCG